MREEHRRRLLGKYNRQTRAAGSGRHAQSRRLFDAIGYSMAVWLRLFASKTPLIEEYYVAVDRQLKSGFGTYEAAEKAAKEIKKNSQIPR
jgi:hypothetical protein